MPWQRTNNQNATPGWYRPAPSGGLSMGPGNARGYQSQSEGFYNRAGQTYDTLGSYGGQMLGDYTGRWMPRMDQLWTESRQFSPEDNANRAAVDVNAAYDSSRGQMQRGLSRMGINPNSGRFAGLQQQWGIARAAALAGAMNRARAQGKEENFLRAMRVLGLAQNTASMGAGMLGQQAAGMMGLGREYGQIAGDAGALEAYRAGLSEAFGMQPQAAGGAGATVQDARAGGGLNLTPQQANNVDAELNAFFGPAAQRAPSGSAFVGPPAPARGYFIDSSGRRHTVNEDSTFNYGA
jgi:hypothetical protein